MKKIFLLLLAISTFGIQTINGQSKKELKKQQQLKEYEATKKLIEKGNFVFEPNWVTSQKGRRVNITGDGNTLTIDGQTSTADLPFFGQAHIASYGGSGGIVFTNSDTEYKIEYNEKKMRISIKFQGKENSENFDLFLEVFSNGNANLRVSSSNRSSISYDGKVSVIPDKKDK